MTNGDKIRAMDDNDLAIFLMTVEAMGWQNSSIAKDDKGNVVDMFDWMCMAASEA